MVRDVLVKNNIPFVEVPDEAASTGRRSTGRSERYGREFTLATNR